MTMFAQLVLVATVTIYIVDLSGFTDAWRSAIARGMHIPESNLRPLKPFDCSLCMTWWTGLAYALITRNLSIPIVAFCALMAYLSFPISQLMIFIHSTLMQWMSRR